MIFIFGGIFQGKVEFAKSLGANHNLVKAIDKNYQDNMILYGLEDLVLKLITENIDVIDYFKEEILIKKNLIIVGNEIGLGVVPIKKEDRELRDQVGFLYQELTTESKEVYRVWNGISRRVK